MRKKLAAVTIGGVSLIGGGATGAILFTPGLASAQAVTTTVPEEGSTTTTPEAATPRPGVSDVLDGLVADGTLTREQADKVATALAEAHTGSRGGPGRRGGPGPGGIDGAIGRGPGFSLSTVAEALGMGEDEVAQALRDGTTVAALAQEQGVDVATVTDALVAAATSRLDEAVAAGRLSQERADGLAAGLAERIATMVEEGRPAPAFGPGHGRGHHGELPEAGEADDAGDDPAAA